MDPFYHHPPTHSHIHPDNKGFRSFKKGRSSLVFLKAPFSFLIHILNWKDCQVDPIGFAPLFPSGDKECNLTGSNNLDFNRRQIISIE